MSSGDTDQRQAEPQTIDEVCKAFRIAHVWDEHATLRFFESRQSALEHICNHLLTYPESDKWRLLARVLRGDSKSNSEGSFKQYTIRMRQEAPVKADFSIRADKTCLPIPEDSNERFKLAKALWKNYKAKEYSEEERSICGFYAECSSIACVEARKLKWWTKSLWQLPAENSLDRFEALGLGGLYVVFNKKQVVSAYLPQIMDQEAFAQPVQKPTSKNPLPREGKLKLPDWNREREKRKRKAAKKKQAQRTLEERIYYEIFRPAVQSVRQRVCDSFDISGKRISQSSTLGSKLPTMSRLRFEEWKQLWAESGG